MRIRVYASTHQGGWDTEGTVIAWVTTAERYGDNMLQVPAVILRIGDKVKVVPLAQQYHTIEITVLKD